MGWSEILIWCSFHTKLVYFSHQNGVMGWRWSYISHAFLPHVTLAQHIYHGSQNNMEAKTTEFDAHETVLVYS